MGRGWRKKGDNSRERWIKEKEGIGGKRRVKEEMDEIGLREERKSEGKEEERNKIMWWKEVEEEKRKYEGKNYKKKENDKTLKINRREGGRRE